MESHLFAKMVVETCGTSAYLAVIIPLSCTNPATIYPCKWSATIRHCALILCCDADHTVVCTVLPDHDPPVQPPCAAGQASAAPRASHIPACSLWLPVSPASLRNAAPYPCLMVCLPQLGDSKCGAWWDAWLGDICFLRATVKCSQFSSTGGQANIERRTGLA